MLNGQEKIRYHGKKKTAGYWERWKRETKFSFDDGNFVLYTTENNNGDLCAYDADMLVVGYIEWRVRFWYDGTPVRGKYIDGLSLSDHSGCLN